MCEGLTGGMHTLKTKEICLNKIYCILVEHNYREEIYMKNKRISVSNSSGKKNTPKHQLEKTEPVFKQLVTDAGFSKKTADELSRWYEDLEWPMPQKLLKLNPQKIIDAWS